MTEPREPPSDPTTDPAGGGTQPGTGGERTFTQADLDRIVADRLQRERAKYADYDDLKTKAEQLRQIEDAQKTELERAQEEAKKAREERDRAMQEAQDRLIQAAFVSEAAKLNAAHPADAYHLADLSGITVSESGGVEGVAEIVKGLVDSGRLPVSGRPRAPSLDGGAGGGERPGDQTGTLSNEEAVIARKLGLKPEDYLKARQERDKRSAEASA